MRSDIFRRIEAGLATKLPLPAYCRVVNLRNSLRGKKHRISPIEGDTIHLADDGEENIHLCRRGRHNRYKHGVMAGVDALARDYHLHTLPPISDGLFIDCGANIGELGYWARARGMDYLPFEPEPLEARCSDLNNFDGKPHTRRQALWKETTVLEFYSKPDTADSSLFDMGGGEGVIRLDAVALDSVVDLTTQSGTVIFKLEAEGAEPEVLEGAAKSLAHIDYVSVDCGYERGRDKKHTFVETNTILQDHHFRLQQAQFRRITALYHNMAR
jgi:FkbM family methyltransferase